MRAAVHRAFGGPEVVRIEEVPVPSPGPKEVLVRVSAAGVNSSDSRVRGRRFPPGFGAVSPLIVGVTGPRTTPLGGTYAGEVDRVGKNVTGWAPGDQVAGSTGMRMGTHAEYVTVPAARLVARPGAVRPVEAAGVIFGGHAALHSLRDLARDAAGTSVLVIGASGAIGTSAVQLASRAGATVTGVCSEANADLVRELGARHVIDHRREDVTRTTQRYDLVLDAVGGLDRRSGRRLLTERGTLVLIVAGLGDVILARGPVRAGPAPERTAGIAHLLDLVAAGQLRVVIDDVLPLERIAEAHARVDSGRKVGNLLITP